MPANRMFRMARPSLPDATIAGVSVLHVLMLLAALLRKRRRSR